MDMDMETGDLRTEIKGIRGVVHAYEWGPSLDKLIIEFTGRLSGTLNTKTFSLVGASAKGEKRTVTAAYFCDENGVQTDMKTCFAAIELGVGYKGHTAFGAAFSYSLFTGCNTWVKSFAIKLQLAQDSELCVGRMRLAGSLNGHIMVPKDITVPDVEPFATDSYIYRGPVGSIGGEEREIKLNRAYYAPSKFTYTKGMYDRKPLIIWLHGAGEGAAIQDDISIALLGNEVTALVKEHIQSFFPTGACVLALQCKTMWMDRNGERTYNHKGSRIQTSYYTEALMEAIRDTVSSHNEIDRSRIYLGGCSNGGYMVMNLMYTYPDFFAAYFPICEAYLDINVSDDKIAATKDNPIWFTQSEDDPTVKPKYTTVPTYYRYIKAGATNTHFTFVPNVIGMDAPGFKYYGHWSWVYVLKDAEAGHKDFNPADVMAAGSVKYITASNCTTPADFWTWLSMQRKAAK
ncbi:MAG: prolyl oligopeptidase family serine peptidase [Clostridia bacterium]|nr:prolyl oligopeptidase family serine peptidase [Clostridia bacterium]